MTSDFAGTVVGGKKVCVSWADKFKFCRANFLEHQQRHKKYNTLTNNCSSFVCEAVKKGGVYVPPHVIDIQFQYQHILEYYIKM